MSPLLAAVLGYAAGVSSCFAVHRLWRWFVGDGP